MHDLQNDVATSTRSTRHRRRSKSPSPPKVESIVEDNVDYYAHERKHRHRKRNRSRSTSGIPYSFPYKNRTLHITLIVANFLQSVAKEILRLLLPQNVK